MGNVVISPNVKKTSERIDPSGNVINARTKEIIKPVEIEYVPPVTVPVEGEIKPEIAPQSNSLSEKIESMVNAKISAKIDEIVDKKVAEILNKL